MTKKDFDSWFNNNLELMSSLGVMHPNSPWGKSIRLSMSAVMPTIEALSNRVVALEEEVATLKQKVGEK